MSESTRVVLPRAEMTEIVMPGDANIHGTLFGGKMMQWIDTVAAIAASRHAGLCVTASVDSLQFKKPVRVGDIVTLKAAVNRAWESSMEVGVRVCSERIRDAHKCNRQLVCRAYLTFVTVNEQGKRVYHERDVVPEGEEWIRRHAMAETRRRLRLQEKI